MEHRIAVALALLWIAFCFALAAVCFVNVPRIESPERYILLAIGLGMLYMGGSMLSGVIRPPKPKDPNAPIEIPPLDQVRGRTVYRDGSVMTRNVMFAVGAIFFAASIGAAEQPVVLVVALIATGVMAGAGVLTWRQMQYGRGHLELAAPARRGDTMQGVITTSGSGWTGAREIGETVDLVAIRTYRASRGRSRSFEVARASAKASATVDGRDVTVRFTTDIPIIDTSEGNFSWNVQLETQSPRYRSTFEVDVA